ncbi:MAG: RnfABCDGE type electron transport complex subunit D [Gammaproteobacteria bacterium]|nr:MAG: RnfABCDGE type electron transport complex subunit D [Gammaproteobacteria bacterium]
MSSPSSAAPHAHDRSTTERIMLHVCLALTPATGLGFYLFGWPAIILWSLTCLAAVVTEMLCLWLQQQPLRRVLDSSALLTGWLLAMSLPPWAPWWIGVGGAAFAIAVGKQLYGGIGQNVFNPAMLARVALLISFPVQMTTWVNVTPLGSALAPDFQSSLALVLGLRELPDGLTGATILGQLKAATELQPVPELISDSYALKEALLGTVRGSLGETSELLVLLGGLWLLAKRIISWHIPVAMLGTTALVGLMLHHGSPTEYPPFWVHLTSGGVMLGALFIATDYVTSPSTPVGKLIFGSGCGLVLFCIRSWGGFPEGVAFAVLFMNALTPLIDRAVKPRTYGRDLRGKPLKKIPDARKVL